jgi:DNA-binding PadR family transcriptional regulator
MTTITRTEEILLLMVCRLGDEAFAMQIREEVKSLTGKLYSIGGIYVPLDRLTAKGLLLMEDVMSDEDRLGRPRRRFKITSRGVNALKETRKMEQKLWDISPELQNKLGLA